MTVRKKWSTTTVLGARRRSHSSKAAAYRYVQAEARYFHAGMLRADYTQVTVWCDEGEGWRKYEVVRLADVPEAAS